MEPLQPMPYYFKLFSVGFFCIASIFAYSQRQYVGEGYYNLTMPPGEKGPSNSAGVPAYPKVTSDFSKPIQTNDWWTSFLWTSSVFQYTNWDNHSWPSYAHPLAYQACRYGLKMKYPDQYTVSLYNGDPKGTYKYEMGAEDLAVTVLNMDLTNDSSTKVKDYSDWTVTAFWDDSKGKTLTATMGHGFVYTYFTKTGGDIIIRFRGDPYGEIFWVLKSITIFTAFLHQPVHHGTLV
jgi:endoglucanase Acf2